MNKSAIPYRVCRKYDNKYGRENKTRFFKTLPLVRFLSITILFLSFANTCWCVRGGIHPVYYKYQKYKIFTLPSGSGRRNRALGDIIENILYLNPQDEKNDKLYYLMKPVEDEKEKIYVPVSNSDSRLRLCLTKEEAWNLIKRIPDIPTAWTNNEKMREQNYKEAVKANDPEALVAIIKMIYQRKEKRLAQGKKCTATDARYFQLAENLLYMELGVALGKPKQEVCRTIIEYITNNGQ